MSMEDNKTPDVPWQQILDSLESNQEYQRLKDVPGGDKYHREGSAMVHTAMTVEAAKKEFGEDSFMVLVAALHDVGKIYTARPKDENNYEYPFHAKTGAEDKILSQFIPQDHPLYKTIQWYVANHMKPMFFIDKDPEKLANEKKFIMLYAPSRLATMENLARLTKCDINGSRSEEPQTRNLEYLDKLIKEDRMITPKDEKGKYYVELGRERIPISEQLAEHIHKQNYTLANGKEFSKDFPKTITHTNLAFLTKSDGYEAAKHGSLEEAQKVVSLVIKPDHLEKLAKDYPGAVIVYSRTPENGNKLPQAYAMLLEQKGFSVNHDIHQVLSPHHTGVADTERLLSRARFAGKIEADKNYIILDDQVSSGATIRDMKDFIQSQGGNVIAVTSLSTSRGATFIAPKEERIQELEDLGVTDEQLSRLGISNSIRNLTSNEAERLARLVEGRQRERENPQELDEAATRTRNTNAVRTINLPVAPPPLQRTYNSNNNNQMEENLEKKMTPSEQRANIIIEALQRGINTKDGVYANSEQRQEPRRYYPDKNGSTTISPGNGILLALEAENKGYNTNMWMTFREATNSKNPVKGHSQSVPIMWKFWDTFESKDANKAQISRQQWQSLPQYEQSNWKPIAKDFDMPVFNIDQTILPNKRKADYAELLASEGGVEDRIRAKTGEEPTKTDLAKEDRSSKNNLNAAIASFIDNVDANLVRVKYTDSSTPRFNPQHDSVTIPDGKGKPRDQWAQGVVRQISRATQGDIRLNSENDAPKAQLVAELASAYWMIKHGRPASLTPQGQHQAETWIKELQKNPHLADEVLNDVSKVVRLMEKADRGERVTLNIDPTQKAAKDLAAAAKRQETTMQFDYNSMIKQNDKWILLVKPKGENAFAVEPTPEDRGLFFNTIKNPALSPQDKDAFRATFAQKYVEAAQQNKAAIIDVFGKPTAQESAIISNPNVILNTRKEPIITASLNGQKQQGRMLTPDEWHTLLIAPNPKEYKTFLAAKAYAPEIKQILERQSVSPSLPFEQTPQQKAGMALRNQMDDVKRQNPGAVLLFKDKEGYSMYEEDARKASHILDRKPEAINVFQREDGSVMARLHIHTNELNSTVQKLASAGVSAITLGTNVKEQQVQSDEPKVAREILQQDESQDEQVSRGRGR